jgi:pimeloyl-ACP methyl ester carboxylesterase
MCTALLAQGKNPVILIPGLSGSELRHKGSSDRVWFKTFKSKSEDLRLPIEEDPTKMGDSLTATDVLRGVKIGIFPSMDVYGGFIKAMETRGGYHEEKWATPTTDGDHDSLYVFPYDWRLDNVSNARLLVRQVEELRRVLKKPELKFDVVAHSMGGIIARYAAMYGDSDLPPAGRKPMPTWAGAKFFDRIILMGTPNEGSVLTLRSLVNGFTLGGLRIDLPFVQDTSRFTVFSIPSGFQLLPAPGTLNAYDERLKPIDLDIYDPAVWHKYGWNPIDDKKFRQKFSQREQNIAPAYFANVLRRAKRLHEALAAAPGKSGGIIFYTLGSDCKASTDALVIYRDPKKGVWKTLFKADKFTRSDGVKVTADELKPLIETPGDGVVTQKSLEAATLAARFGVRSIVDAAEDKFICEGHNGLATNSKIQDYIIDILKEGKSVESNGKEK